MEYVSGTLVTASQSIWLHNQLATPEIFTTVNTANLIKYFVPFTYYFTSETLHNVPEDHMQQ